MGGEDHGADADPGAGTGVEPVWGVDQAAGVGAGAGLVQWWMWGGSV